MTSKNQSELDVERLKFIYGQIADLNQNIHKQISLFHTLVTAIIGGGVSVFVGWKKLDLDPSAAKIAITGLLWLLCLVSALVIVSIIVGIISWYDYRKEESEIFFRHNGAESRMPPKISNFWRWNETYYVIFIVAAVVAIWLYVRNYIIVFVI